MIRIALVGNPNCGKTTVFNELTGSSQYVGNWPGVTVEKKTGKLRRYKSKAEVVDLPGIYSLSPYSLEEVVARDFLVQEQPEVILNVVDASNLERNLYLTHQLLETGIPVVMALNMMDVIKKRGEEIKIEELSKKLKIPVVPICALKNEGFDELVKTVLQLGEKAEDGSPILFTAALENTVENIAAELGPVNLAGDKRWLAIKLLENDSEIVKKLFLNSDLSEKIADYRLHLENLFDDDIESIIANERYEFMTNLCQAVKSKSSKEKLTVSDKIDKIVTNRFLALPIFFCVMSFIYWITITSVGDMTIGWVEGIFEWLSGAAEGILTSLNAAEWIHSFVLDGVLAGLGTIFSFVPQLMLLYLFIGLLEDCGYMARVAFIMDRMFRRFGLSGKSFIPMLIGSGCSVPAIMASRTIENDKDRKMTIMLTPFIPCGAKLPVFALFIAAFFPDNPWAGASMYLVGIGMVILSGIILKAVLFKGETAPFVMELPEYRLPRLKGVCIQMWERAKAFIVKAGTVMFLAVALVWFLQTFDFSFNMVESEESILASLGRMLAPLFAPLGFGNWQSAVACVTGLLAKEAVVSTFGVLVGLGEVGETDAGLISQMPVLFNSAAAYAFMVFTLLSAPCAAAIGAMKKEFGTWRWTLLAICYQTGLAWLVALVIYQAACGNIVNLILGGIILAVVIAVLLKFIRDTKSGSCTHGCSGCNGKCTS